MLRDALSAPAYASWTADSLDLLAASPATGGVIPGADAFSPSLPADATDEELAKIIKDLLHKAKDWANDHFGGKHYNEAPDWEQEPSLGKRVSDALGNVFDAAAGARDGAAAARSVAHANAQFSNSPLAPGVRAEAAAFQNLKLFGTLSNVLSLAKAYDDFSSGRTGDGVQDLGQFAGGVAAGLILGAAIAPGAVGVGVLLTGVGLTLGLSYVGGAVAGGIYNYVTTYYDPLVIDLNGDGLHFTALTQSRAAFDFAGNGTQQHGAWVSAGDGLLVVDKNHNSRVDNLSEVLSESFAKGQAANGYAALRLLDANHDGKVDASEAAQAGLQVWRDANQDGQTDAGELHSFADLGISEISTTRGGAPAALAEGGALMGTGAAVMGGGTVTVGEASLAVVAGGYTTEQVSNGILFKDSSGAALPVLRLATLGGSYSVATGLGGVVGTSYADVITQTNASGVQLAGLDGADTLTGGAGGDMLDGGAAGDRLNGGAGDDELAGGAGADTLSGGAGDDLLMIDADDPLSAIDGGDGVDTLQITGDVGRVVDLAPRHIEIAAGSAGDDRIYTSGSGDIVAVGGAGNDTLQGGDGDDVLSGGDGDDRIEGGDGFDKATFEGRREDYSVSISGGAAIVTKLAGAAGADTVIGVERLIFEDGSIHLAGDNQAPAPGYDNLGALAYGATALTVTQADLLANDRDPDGDHLTVVAVGQAVGGRVALTAGGDIRFELDAENARGGSFSYWVDDSHGGLSRAVATVQAAGVTAADPVAETEWQLAATRAPEVWDAYTGRGVVVGVSDVGVDYTHPDLASVYDQGRDFNFSTGLGVALPGSDPHGTAIAGIVAGAKDAEGMVGIAPGATLTGFTDAEGFYRAWENAGQGGGPHVDVVNNSWAYRPFGVSLFGDWYDEGLQRATTEGRGGLGIINVFAAGNERADGGNADYLPMTNSRFSISVGAMDLNEKVASFSNPGSSVLVTAPGVDVPTVDWLGTPGFTDADYDAVSGTSAAAPVVSGVVALMLEANPELGYRDVQQILAASAVKVDRTSLDWTTNGADNWNGGGYHVNRDYGFGLVDAHAAVRLAETWQGQQTEANILKAQVAQSGLSVAIPDGGSVQIPFTVTQAISLEHVTLNLDISHAQMGDLRVRLISPDGTESLLLDRVGKAPGNPADLGDASGGTYFELTSVRHMGELAAGTWTLIVDDAHPGVSGVLNGYTVGFYGSAPSADDVYIYTDEFAATGHEPGRRLLADADGGTDTLNASAVTSPVRIDLTPGAISTVANTPLVIDAGTTIENAYSGDGDDILLGNGQANRLVAGRGDDVLDGRAGGDVLDGGAGFDVAAYTHSGAGVAVDLAAHTASGGEADGDTLLAIEGVIGSQHADQLAGDSGTNLLRGGEGDDQLDGRGGDDNLLGDAGADTLAGGDGDDVLFGGAGSDHLDGGAGLDVAIFAGRSTEYVVTTAGEVATVAGGEGQTSLTGVELLRFSDRDVRLAGENHVPVVGPGLQVAVAAGGGVAIAAADLLATASDADGDTLSIVGVRAATGGVASLDADGQLAFTAADGFIGQGAVTVMVADVYGGMADVTVTFTVADTHILSGGTGGDTLTAGGGADTLAGGAGGDVLAGAAGSDAIDGGDGDDRLVGGTGDDTLSGGAGDDNLSGGDGADQLTGGVGDDVLAGGAGNDTYVFASGHGVDTIHERSETDKGTDTIRFGNGIAPADVVATRHAQDLWLSEAGGDVIKVAGFFDFSGQPASIERVVFADGTTWTGAQVAAAATVVGTDGADVLYGRPAAEAFDGGAGDDSLDAGGGADTLTGGAGADTLDGGPGSDRYLWARGDGDDRIHEWNGLGANDTLVLQGVNAADVRVARAGGDLVLHVAPTSPGGDGAVLTVVSGFVEDSQRGIEQVVTADANWSLADLRVRYLQQDQTAGADSIVGFSGADDMGGGGGADTLAGLGGSDTLVGGLGDDSLNGGDGNDTFVWSRGDGADVIADQAWSSSSSDRLLLHGVAVGDVTAVRAGYDAILQIAGSDGGSIRLVDELNRDDQVGVSSIVFDDGATWTASDLEQKFLTQAITSGADSIEGFANDDTLAGGLGDDSLSGGEGNDTYVWARGDGADVITDSGWVSSSDRLLLHGVSVGDVTVSRDGYDAILQIAGSNGGSVRLTNELYSGSQVGVGSIIFDDGATWTGSDLKLKLLAQAITPGADTIEGFGGDDTISGGAGDDALDGGYGNDTYVWSRGDGSDTIFEGWGAGADRLLLHGVTPADVLARRDGVDLLVTVSPSATGSGDGGVIRVVGGISSNSGVETLVFDDGTVWTASDLRAHFLTPTEGPDTIVTIDGVSISLAGLGGDDSLSTGSGSDTLAGGAGDDTLSAGEGSDTYGWGRGDGDDQIDDVQMYLDRTAIDRLVLRDVLPGDVTLTNTFDSLTVTIGASGAAAGGSITIRDSFSDGNEGMERIEFADGTSWTAADVRARLLASVATGGSDDIRGFQSGDSIDAGAGDDTVQGLWGADTLVGGAGNDSLSGDGDNDTYVWSPGAGDDVISDGGYDLGDRLLIHGVDPGAVQVSRDGWDALLHLPSSPGLADGGTIRLLSSLNSGYQGVDQVVFDNGVVWDHAALASQIPASTGNSGPDTLFGTSGADTLEGGTGDDSLSGGEGDDLYVWSRGDGDDAILDGAWGSENTLALHGVAPGDVSVQVRDESLTVVIAPSAPGADDGGSVRMIDDLANGDCLKQIVFDDGTTWLDWDFRTPFVTPTTGDDTLLGNAFSDYFLGDSGNDLIIGGVGYDWLEGGSGDDTLSGGADSDWFAWSRGAGDDRISDNAESDYDSLYLTDVSSTDVTFHRSGSNLVVEIAPSAPGAGDGGTITLVDNLGEEDLIGADWIFFGGDGVVLGRADFLPMAAGSRASPVLWDAGSLRASALPSVDTGGDELPLDEWDGESADVFAAGPQSWGWSAQAPDYGRLPEGPRVAFDGWVAA